jgi:glycosyltransferase involved in cell wall biosynthesis
MEHKKVLIISYYWPPAGGVSVQRVLKFCKYLPDFGVHPYVLTVKDGSYPTIDETLMNEIPQHVQVFRSSSIEPFRIYNFLRGKTGKAVPMVEAGIKNKTLIQRIAEFIRANLFIPDARVGWYFFAIKTAREIIEREKIDVVITTGPPHSTHLIGLYLKRRCAIKWIVDFRDPWVELFASNFLPRTKLTLFIDRCFENRVIEKADKIILVGKRLASRFNLKKFMAKTAVITNGFDFELKAVLDENKEIGNKFVIRYIGTFFSSQNIPAFWNTISDMIQSDEQFKVNLSIEFIGKVDDEIKDEIRNFGLGKYVSYIGFVTHAEAIELMMTADCLLLSIPNVVNNEVILTGKLFEYIACKKPIICFGPADGDAADIIRATDSGFVFDYDNTSKLSECIGAIYHQTTTLKYRDIEAYSRKMLTEKLAKIIKREI